MSFPRTNRPVPVEAALNGGYTAPPQTIARGALGLRHLDHDGHRVSGVGTLRESNISRNLKNPIGFVIGLAAWSG
jgi:hypothetical protein